MSGLPNHFYDLVLACLYGLADEGQSAELSALLEKDGAARQEYIDFLCMYAHLHRRKGACLFVEPSTDETLLNEYAWKALAEEEKRAEAVLVERLMEEPVPAGGGGREELRRAPVSKLSIYSLILSTAALIFLIAYAYLSPHRGEAASVGRVSRTADAVWQGVSGHMAEGCEVYPGPLKLVKGLAEITLETGARVVLEGPCSVTVETPLQVYLAEGRLSALVKGGSRQAFVVRSPTASVVDYGTEFGVFVKPDGQTEAYVYEGMVQMRDSSDPVRFSKSMLLKKGQSGVSDGDGQLSDLPVNPYHFVRVGDMEVFEQARNIGGYYRWRSWVYRVHREDSSLAGHYFFERDGGDEDCLVNAAGKGGAASGRFGDAGRNKPSWVPGRWPQKEGVRFERGRKQVIVIPAEPSLAFVQPLTISTWIYFPDKGRWGGHLISCRDKYRINYQFSLFDDQYAYQYQKNRFEFRQYDGAGKAGFYSQVFVPEERKWYHFAVVFDGREVRFYVNGELFQAAPYSGMANASAAEIVLGAMKIDGYVLPEGDFDGVVDELMLFRRCLSGAEIRDIYENGKP